MFAEVDYVLATKLDLLETVKDKIKYKQAYVSECNEAMPEDDNIIVLNEEIIEIKTT